MGIYARQRRRLVAQVAADVFVLAWAVGCWLAGLAVTRAVLRVADPARETAEAAGRISGQFREASSQAAQVPGIGVELRRPLDAASTSFADVVAAANEQVVSIERLANLAGWLVFGIPVAILLALWLPRRLMHLLRARTAQVLLDSTADLDLFALRAMATQPMHVLAKISPDPVGAWRTGDATVIHKLADAELRRSGLRMPTLVPSVAVDEEAGHRRKLS